MAQPQSDLAGLHAIVEGRVQGVGFRAFVQETAFRLGLNGWVRNRYDGTVEVLAEGERMELNRLIAALRRGPAPYTSMGVAPDWRPYTGEFTRFSIKPTE